MTAAEDNGAGAEFFRTDRLIIRRLAKQDLEWLVGHRRDDEVVKYLGGRTLQTDEFIGKRLNAYIESYKENGFGVACVIWKETGERIGVAGLQPHVKSGEIEVGYSLDKQFWGKGIATECARAWLEYGFNKAGLERIIAIAEPGNEGSVNVMKKLGMKYVGTEFSYGIPVVRYAIARSDYGKGPAV